MVSRSKVCRPMPTIAARTMKLSMIVLITSCEPRVALSTPGIAPTAIEHGDAIGQREDLVELGRQQQDRGARGPNLQDLRVDPLDRTDVDAARGLRTDQHGQRALELASDDDLLLVTAGKRRHRGC